MWQRRVGTASESVRLRPVVVVLLCLVGTLLLTSGASAGERSGTDTPSDRSWPGIALRFGPSFGQLSGAFFRPAATGISGEIGLIIPIGHRFAVRADVQATAMNDDPDDVAILELEPTDTGRLDLWRWMLSVTGYSNSHWYRQGTCTPYVTLGAGVARRSVTKFAAQFGGGSLVMLGEGIGIDVGVGFTCVMNGFGEKYQGKELSGILDLKAAFVLNVR
jgi:hypothetical protein